MNWRRSLLGVAIAVPVIAVLAFGLTRDPAAIPSPLPGHTAPTFTLTTMDGSSTVRLADHAGRIVVLNFWASWCLPCRDEHRDLQLAARQYASRGVDFYGVLYNDTPENGQQWLEQMGGQAYPTLIDPGSRTAIDYGIYGVPETFIIDGDGRVVHKEIGPVTQPRLASILDPLLAERSARP